MSVKVSSVTLKYQGNTPSTGDIVTVTAGRAATFTCIPSTSRPQATIDWYIQDIHGTTKVKSGSATYDLTATDVDHNKRIYCKAYNNVIGAQEILSEKPFLYVQGKNTGIKTLFGNSSSIYSQNKCTDSPDKMR